MPNMGYCRFENTLADLRDCYEHWEEKRGEDRSESEQKAQARMLKLCQRIVADYGEEGSSD